MLTNEIVSLEQLAPGHFNIYIIKNIFTMQLSPPQPLSDAQARRSYRMLLMSTYKIYFPAEIRKLF